MQVCEYIKQSQDGYGTNWKTSCGHKIRYNAPIEVGFSSAPLPNESGKFCSFCGKLIEIPEPYKKVTI